MARPKKTDRISVEELAKFVSYDVVTGVMTWNVRMGKRVKAGDVAGYTLPSGHRRLTINGKVYSASQIAFALGYGRWTDCQISYLNGNPDDNSLSNLREQVEGPANDPDYYRGKQYERYYGLTMDGYNKMFVAQNGKCAICGKSKELWSSDKVKFLHVDHCHDTGEIRGLLCYNCNNGIGALQDNPDYCDNAGSYLRRFKMKEAA